MIISEIKRSDIDLCAFLMKILQAGKFELEGSAVKNMHDTFEWVQKLAVAMADGWNAQTLAQAPKPDGPTNIKIKNPPGAL